MIARDDHVCMASILILILLVLGPLAYFLGTDSRVDEHDRRRR
jgi:hypothetical protein